MTGTLAQAIPGEFIEIAVDPITEPFFQAGKEGRLVAPQCAECKTFRMPPSPFCPNCSSEAVDWVELSGRGKVYTYSICTRSPFRGKTPDITYIPVVVELPDAGGVRLNINLVEIDPADVRIGMDVEIFWSPITDGWLLPICRPSRESGTTKR
jgi:uncharacterized OB-fold protein